MFLIRLLIVGETGVGKTSVLMRFNEDSFSKQQKATIGVDYRAKEMILDGEEIKLQIWDTAGQERFRSMTSAFYHRAQGIVFMFDVSQKNSLYALPSWIKDVGQNAPSNCATILCANKADLPLEHWEVKKEEYEAFAQEVGMKLVETSASTGLNVQELFLALGRDVMARSKHDLARMGPERDENIVIFDPPPKKKRMCC